MNQPNSPPSQPPASRVSWRYIARTATGKVVEGWLLASPDIERAVRQVRRANPDLVQIDLMSRGQSAEPHTAGPPLRE